MSDLLKLKSIAERNGDIKAFCLSSNMISSNLSKGKWGDVKIAIDNESIHRIMNDEVVGVLYITTKAEWNV